MPDAIVPGSRPSDEVVERAPADRAAAALVGEDGVAAAVTAWIA
jgi:hypothetical protein